MIPASPAMDWTPRSDRSAKRRTGLPVFLLVVASVTMALPPAGAAVTGLSHDALRASVGTSSAPGAHASSSAVPSTAATGHASAPSGAKASPHAAAAVGAFNPPCYPVDTGVCVSIASENEPEIIPNGSSHVSPVMPSCTQDMSLTVKSHNPLNSSTMTSPPNGPHAPIALNVTETLWNGDPYFSKYDNSIWHSNTGTWWTGPTMTNNHTYPYWYNVTFSAKGLGGVMNLYPGALVNWWIYLVYSLPNNAYVGHEGSHLSFTCAGAWPYSPYPGSPHYGGPSAIFLDTNISLFPRQPNWNDSVHVTVNTTQADVAPYNATIGAATIDIVEISHSQVVVNTSWSFNVTVNAGFGNTTTTSMIGPQFSQIEGATISYRVWIDDTSPINDWLVSPWTNYTVNGNGSFPTGSFTSDLTLDTNPSSVVVDNYGLANLTPGQPLAITVTSRNPTDAILAVQVLYTVAYPLLHETIPRTMQLHRHSSVDFRGSLPALPLNTIVNFTVLAWDFTDAVEQSNPYSYTVMTFDQYNGPLGNNLAFFFVFVYDNGTGTWVQGAEVQVQGVHNGINSVSNTTLGVAYANQSKTPLVPLLLQANATYNVTVTDPAFVPANGFGGPYGAISVQVKATNPMNQSAPIASTPSYIVLQQGNQILFYLNSSAPPTPASPSVAAGSPVGSLGLGAMLGIVGAAATGIPLAGWWARIKARRTAEEKRVTL